MQNLKLIIGNKTRSTWSLRAWLFLKHHNVPFEEVRVNLGRRNTRTRILEHSPSGKVPCLVAGDIRVWESLAICEFAAEMFALPGAWPLAPSARAMARSVAHEMHAGFADLRRDLPYEALRKPSSVPISEKAQADIERVRRIWREARTLYGQGGEWLFGKFGIADAMFAPLALRFQLYEVPLDGPEREYMYHVLMHPAIQAWLDGALLEQPVREEPLERTIDIAPNSTTQAPTTAPTPNAAASNAPRELPELELPPTRPLPAALPEPEPLGGKLPSGLAPTQKTLRSTILPP